MSPLTMVGAGASAAGRTWCGSCNRGVDREADLLLRRVQDDPGTLIDFGDRAVGSQLFQRSVDRLAQFVVWTDHADSDIPVQVRLTLVGPHAPQLAGLVNEV